MQKKRKRRGSLAPFRQFPKDAVILATVPAVLPRYTEARPRKLSTSKADAAIAAIGAGRTLRDVSADFGVSPETVRLLVRGRNEEGLAAD